MRYLLIGNYGVGNAGDEILKDYFLKRFSGHTWMVCSARPATGEYHRFPAGIRSFLGCGWIRTLRALARADGVVFGGGSLCTDTESVSASFVWFVQALPAILFRKPLFLAYQGIGPFRTSFGEWSARFIVKHAAFISVRDTASMDRLLGVEARCAKPPLFCKRAGRGRVWKKNTGIIQTFDPSILLFEEKTDQIRSKNVFIVIPRVSTVWKRRVREHIRVVLEALLAHSAGVRILSLRPGSQREHDLCSALAEPLSLHTEPAVSMQHVFSLLLGAVCVISQRYHGAVAAIAAGVPFVALRQREGDKLDALARMCGCPSETPSTLTGALLTGTDWERMREKLVSLRGQYRKLVIQGEEALRRALSHHGDT